MTTDDILAVKCIRLLADKSVTPQHELITKMMDYFGVNGTNELSGQQINMYISNKHISNEY